MTISRSTLPDWKGIVISTYFPSSWSLRFICALFLLILYLQLLYWKYTCLYIAAGLNERDIFFHAYLLVLFHVTNKYLYCNYHLSNRFDVKSWRIKSVWKPTSAFIALSIKNLNIFLSSHPVCWAKKIFSA